MASESDSSGFQLARFFVNELHTFVVSLKDKLDGMEGTVGTGNLLGSAKKRKKEKRTRAPSAFNLFVKEELLRTKGNASTAPEGTREGAWRMSNAAKKWGTLSIEEKRAFAESKKEALEAIGNGTKVAMEDSPPPASPALAAAVAAPTTDNKKTTTTRAREAGMGGGGDATPAGTEAGTEKKKKKKKKKKSLAADPGTQE